jgi:hypothetical protein
LGELPGVGEAPGTSHWAVGGLLVALNDTLNFSSMCDKYA